MMTDRRFEALSLAPRGLSLTAGVLGAACLLGTSPSAVWAAQDVAAEGRGVIGVNIECESGDAVAECATPPRIVHLEPDWPAAVAGVRLNDRLVSIDGFRVNSAEGLRAIGSMVSGERVTLEVERAGRRLELETIPRAGRVHYQGRVYTRRAAAPPAWTERDSARTRANQFIFVGPDARGSISVRVVGPTESDSMMVDFIRDHAPEAGATRYVVEDADLIRRLRANQGLFLIRAREAFDALNRARMTRPGSGVRVRQLAPSVGPTGLIAGAQFIRLTPAMSENLRGPEQGCLVLRVIPDTPAARIGLQEGDIVTEVAGISTETLERLHAAFEQSLEANELKVAWQRRGASHNGVLVTDGE